MAVAIKFQNERTIHAPIEEVFDFIADARNDPKWCPGVASVKQQKGGVGDADAVYEYGQRMGEEVIPMPYTVDSSDRPRKIVWKVDVPGVNYQSIFEFADRDGRTHIVQYQDTRLADPPDEAQEQMQADAEAFSDMQFENLARLMEAS